LEVLKVGDSRSESSPKKLKWTLIVTVDVAPVGPVVESLEQGQRSPDSAQRLQWRTEGLGAAQIRAPRASGSLQHVEFGEPVGARTERHLISADDEGVELASTWRRLGVEFSEGK
jgi:hypothetical protein